MKVSFKIWEQTLSFGILLDFQIKLDSWMIFTLHSFWSLSGKFNQSFMGSLTTELCPNKPVELVRNKSSPFCGHWVGKVGLFLSFCSPRMNGRQQFDLILKELPTGLMVFSDWKISVLFVFVFVFGLCHTACEILVPWPGIEPEPLAVNVQRPNHWTAREFPRMNLLLRNPFLLGRTYFKPNHHTT